MTRWQEPPQLRDVPRPEPAAGEVLLKVAGAGACHSDLHIMDWPPGKLPGELPFTLGHENTGWVEQLGDGVTGLELGEPVAVYGAWGCGRCGPCRRSEENLCEAAGASGAAGGGLGRDGGMAEYLLVPAARFLVPIQDMDPVEAAPLSDAALTPYHSIKRNLHRLSPGSSALVIGVGGLGHMAIQILRAVTAATVIAVDVDQRKLELARDSGAHEVALVDQAVADEIRALTRSLGANVVLDFVGSEQTLRVAASAVKAGGEVAVIGLAGGVLPFSFGVVPAECSITIPAWGSAVELIEVLELARRGSIRARVERFTLDRAHEAYERLRNGSVDGRAVVVPHAA